MVENGIACADRTLSNPSSTTCKVIRTQEGCRAFGVQPQAVPITDTPVTRFDSGPRERRVVIDAVSSVASVINVTKLDKAGGLICQKPIHTALTAQLASPNGLQIVGLERRCLMKIGAQRRAHCHRHAAPCLVGADFALKCIGVHCVTGQRGRLEGRTRNENKLQGTINDETKRNGMKPTKHL